MHRQVLAAAGVAIGFILGAYAYFTQDPASAPAPPVHQAVAKVRQRLAGAPDPAR